MSTHVHECPDLVVSSAHENDRLLGEVESEPIALLRNAALVADAEPVAEMDAVDVAPEDLGIGIEFLEEREPLGLTFDQRCDPVHAADYTPYRVATGIGPERRFRDSGVGIPVLRRSIPGRSRR
jgi:hypothetical protein